MTDNDIGAIARRDRVRPNARNDDVVARTNRYRLVAAIGRARAAARHHIGARNRRQHARGIAHTAILPQHDAAADPGADAVIARAAKHRRIARTDADRAGAAIARVGRLRQAQHARRIGQAAVIAEHHAVASPNRDAVRPNAADHHIIARAQGDGVVAARGRRVRLDRRQDARRVGHAAVMADHDVVAGTPADRIRPNAAEDGVVAGAQGDLVSRAANRGSG